MVCVLHFIAYCVCVVFCSDKDRKDRWRLLRVYFSQTLWVRMRMAWWKWKWWVDEVAYSKIMDPKSLSKSIFARRLIFIKTKHHSPFFRMNHRKNLSNTHTHKRKALLRFACFVLFCLICSAYLLLFALNFSDSLVLSNCYCQPCHCSNVSPSMIHKQKYVSSSGQHFCIEISGFVGQSFATEPKEHTLFYIWTMERCVCVFVFHSG